MRNKFLIIHMFFFFLFHHCQNKVLVNENKNLPITKYLNKNVHKYDSIYFSRDYFSKKYKSIVIIVDKNIHVYGQKGKSQDSAVFNRNSRIGNLLLSSKICDYPHSIMHKEHKYTKAEFIFSHYSDDSLICMIQIQGEAQYIGGSIWEYKIKPTGCTLNDSLNVFLTMRLLGIRELSEDFRPELYEFPLKN